MHRWKTTVRDSLEGEKEFNTITRPFISLGEGMIRIASVESEKWYPLPAQEITVEEVSKQGLMEVLHEKDVDLIARKAFDLKSSEDPDDHVLGNLVLESLRYYKTMQEVIEEEVTRNASSQ